MVHSTLPISRLNPLCSTRVQLYLNQDCGNSSLLPLDSRRDSLHHPVKLNLVHEVYWMPTLDTFFHSQSGSKFPCTHARVQSVYNLHKVNIHKVNIHKVTNIICHRFWIYILVSKKFPDPHPTADDLQNLIIASLSTDTFCSSWLSSFYRAAWNADAV